MGATQPNSASITPEKSINNIRHNPKNEDLVVRDHTFDYDSSGIEYLKAHEIPQLFQDLTERLLSERPLDSLRFLRNILIHKVIQQQDFQHRRGRSPSPSHRRSVPPTHNIPKLKDGVNSQDSSYKQTPKLSPPRSKAKQAKQTKQAKQNKKKCIDKAPFPANYSKTMEPRGQSAKLRPIPNDISSDSIINDSYDADKLLVSRTTKRTRSYSDSAIMFDGQQLYDTYNNKAITVSDINLNQLSKPIDIGPYKSNTSQHACSVSPRDQLSQNKNKNKNQNKTSTKKVMDTISSVMDDMNIDKNHKNALMEHLNEKNFGDDNRVFDNGLPDNAENKNDDSDVGILQDSVSCDMIQVNGKKKRKSQLGDIANKFQNKLKSLSTSAKSIPSKLKHQLQGSGDGLSDDISHISTSSATQLPNDRLLLENKAKSEEFVNEEKREKNNGLYLDDDNNKFPSIKAQPLRRSRTMELISAPPLRHILSLSQRPCFGCDIGGSLTKISFFEPSRNSGWNVHDSVKAKFVTSSTKYGTSGIRDKNLSFPWRNGTFHFIHFQTHRMSEAVSMFKAENLLQKNEIFYATGGGAHKYSKLFTDQLSVCVKKGDELKCLISGLNFLLNHVSDECYYLSDPASKKPSPKISWDIKKEGSVFPYLLVNVGSGVSILKVDSPTQFERVSGTQIGGGTYWGLCRLCSYSVLEKKTQNGRGGLPEEKKNDIDNTSPETLTFKKAFELAMKGNAKKVNMLVSDIYGGDYPQCNLPGDLVASAFGKCISIKDPAKHLEMGDIARGLLDVIAMNCAQLAYLNAMRFKITRIIFAGNFLRQNDLSMAMISYAIHYWSQGVMRACFLKHEGYFGSIGVMLLPDKELLDETEDKQEKENKEDDSSDNTLLTSIKEN